MALRRDPMLLALILAAAALRVPGLFDDLWLDEIWSIRIARELHHLSDVLLSPVAQCDNNAPLNTAFLWMMGAQSHWWVYRMPSLLVGIGSVVLVATIMARRDPGAARLATALVACSHPLVFYSSEARGYALVVFFALLAFDALDRYLDRPRPATALVFGGACLLGFLSHLTFIHAYVAMLAWSLYRRGPSRTLARVHLLPIASIIGIYLLFVRKLVIGGAPPVALGPALAIGISSLVAGAGAQGGEMAVAVLALVVFMGVLASLGRRGNDLWIFLLVGTIVSPAILLAVAAVRDAGPPPFYARHVVVLLPFVLMAVATVVVGAPWRRFGVVLFAAFVAFNLRETGRSLAGTRGHYADAVQYMVEHTVGDTIVVLSDHPARTEMVLNFYGERLPPGKRLLVADANSAAAARPSVPPAWVVAHGFEGDAPPGDTCTDPVSGTVFRLERRFGSYGLSGYSWYLFHRQAAG